MDIVWNNLGAFLQGASVTVRISAVAVCFGLIIGSIFGLMRISGSVILRSIAGVYVEAIRGTPLMVQLYIFILDSRKSVSFCRHLPLRPSLFPSTAVLTWRNRPGRINPLTRADGVGTLPGMTYMQAMRYIILPQAFRRIIPPLVNEFIMLIKDSSLLSVIGVIDDQDRQRISGATYNVFHVFTAVAVIYFIMTFSLSNSWAIWSGGGRSMIKVIDLCKSFGKLEVLKGINLEVKKGEVVVIIGRAVQEEHTAALY